MKVAKIFSIFYFNLMFSSLTEKEQTFLVNNIFKKLLNLSEIFPIGIQLSGFTVEMIKSINLKLFTRFKQQLSQGSCELIGNGYSQMITPLVPSKVNSWNQKLGIQTYEKELNYIPQIATINEMVYSSACVSLLKEHDYRAMLMEWNNPRACHPEWEDEWRYSSQLARAPDGQELPVVWTDSIMFQQFQRYIHGGISEKEYFSFIKKKIKDAGNGFICIYSSDSEIFDFRTNRYPGEAKEYEGEWDKIIDLYRKLGEDKSIKLVLPSEIINSKSLGYSENSLVLESSEQPIIVKKQEKYSINRWALTGKNDLKLNTICYRIARELEDQQIEDESYWKELCFLWSSDIRTHINEDRYAKYIIRLSKLMEKLNVEDVVIPAEFTSEKAKTLNNKKTFFNKVRNHFVMKSNERFISIESDTLCCTFNKLKGLTIKELYFKDISENWILGTLQHGFFDDIRLAADYFSGHSIIEKLGEHKITNLNYSEPEFIFDKKSVAAYFGEKNKDIKFINNIIFETLRPSLTLKNCIDIPSRFKGLIKPLNFTFNPLAFDKNSLFYATHNGGNTLEYFPLGSYVINQSELLSSLISAKNGLGCTEGVIIIGDKNFKLQFMNNRTLSALIPSINYRPVNENLFFLRLQYSAQEMDETFIKNDSRHSIYSEIEISIQSD